MHFDMSTDSRDAGEQANDESIVPWSLEMGKTRCLFHNNIVGNFMIYQDRFETNLLQLFVQQEN